MALERVPADIRKEGGVAGMVSNLEVIFLVQLKIEDCRVILR